MEALQLVDRVVQLGVGVAKLLAVDEKLETLRQFGVRAVTLAQGRHFDRVVRDERRLDKLLLAVLAEDGVDQLALAHRRVGLDVQTLAGFAQLLFALAGDVVAGLFADGVGHRQAAERRFERNLLAVERQLRRAVYGHGDFFEHLLGEFHHPEVVLVGHVNLHDGEFGVVRAIHALVAEILAELVYAVESADDQFLEVQLTGDAQVLVDVERIVVRDERACRGAARNRLQDRGLHLDVAALVEELAHRGDDLGASDEYVAHLRVHHQVDVALAVADFGVGEGVERLAVLGLDDGQRADRLREHRELAAVHRQLARIGMEREAFDADEVADVEQFLEHRVIQRGIAFGADVVAADVDLNAARVVLQFEERSAAHDAARHDAACDADVPVVALGLVEVFGDLPRRGRHFVTGGGVGVDAQLAQGCERLSPELFLFTEFDAHIVCF